MSTDPPALAITPTAWSGESHTLTTSTSLSPMPRAVDLDGGARSRGAVVGDDGRAVTRRRVAWHDEHRPVGAVQERRRRGPEQRALDAAAPAGAGRDDVGVPVVRRLEDPGDGVRSGPGALGCGVRRQAGGDERDARLLRRSHGVLS